MRHQQVHVLSNECGPYGCAVLMMGYAGLRFGELTALRISDIDLVRRRALIRQAVTDVAGRLVVGTPKSHQQREVPLPAFLVERLAVELAGRRPDELAFSSSPRRLLAEHSVPEILFRPCGGSGRTVGLHTSRTAAHGSVPRHSRGCLGKGCAADDGDTPVRR